MKNCTKCDKPMRPDKASIKDWPGTVKTGKVGGECESCRRRTSKLARKLLLPERPLSDEQLAVRRLVMRRCTAAEFPVVAGMLGMAS